MAMTIMTNAGSAARRLLSTRQAMLFMLAMLFSMVRSSTDTGTGTERQPIKVEYDEYNDETENALIYVTREGNEITSVVYEYIDEDGEAFTKHFPTEYFETFKYVNRESGLYLNDKKMADAGLVGFDSDDERLKVVFKYMDDNLENAADYEEGKVTEPVKKLQHKCAVKRATFQYIDVSNNHHEGKPAEGTMGMIGDCVCFSTDGVTLTWPLDKAEAHLYGSPPQLSMTFRYEPGMMESQCTIEGGERNGVDPTSHYRDIFRGCDEGNNRKVKFRLWTKRSNSRDYENQQEFFKALPEFTKKRRRRLIAAEQQHA